MSATRLPFPFAPLAWHCSPDGCVHSLVHLDCIPFSVRAPTPGDVGPLHRLQAFGLSAGFQRRMLTRDEVAAAVGMDRGLCLVADINGAVAAAVMVEPCPPAAGGGEGGSGLARFLMAVVHPALEERTEIFCALG